MKHNRQTNTKTSSNYFHFVSLLTNVELSIFFLFFMRMNQSPKLSILGHPLSACNFTNSANCLISSSSSLGPNVHWPLGVHFSPKPWRSKPIVRNKNNNFFTYCYILDWFRGNLQAFFPCHSMWYCIYPPLCLYHSWMIHNPLTHCFCLVWEEWGWIYLSKSLVKRVAPWDSQG